MHQALSAKYLMNRCNVNVGKESVLSTASLARKIESVIPQGRGDCRKDVLGCGSLIFDRGSDGLLGCER